MLEFHFRHLSVPDINGWFQARECLCNQILWIIVGDSEKWNSYKNSQITVSLKPIEIYWFHL